MKKQIRRITLARLKASPVATLRTLTASGPVEVTLNGRTVALLSASGRTKRRTAQSLLARLARLYSCGGLSWRDVQDQTGAAFGDLWRELGRQNLPLPTVKVPKTPGQAALSEVVLYDFSVIEGLASKIKAGMNCRVFLFGSYAWGRPNEDSDVDLAVVVPDSDYDGRTHIKARKLTEHGLIPIDVLAYRESTFATSAQGSLSFEIKTKGVEL